MKLNKIIAAISAFLMMTSLYSCDMFDNSNSIVNIGKQGAVTTQTETAQSAELNTQAAENALKSEGTDVKKDNNMSSEKDKHVSNYFTSDAFNRLYHDGFTPLDDSRAFDSIVSKETADVIKFWLESACNELTGEIMSNVSCINGYLIIDVYSLSDYRKITDVRNVVIDLYTNKTLDLSDVFYDLSEYKIYCNKMIANVAQQGETSGEYGNRVPAVTKADFTELDDSFSAVTPFGVYIFDDNPFFESGFKYNIYPENKALYNRYPENEVLYNNSIIFSQARDMSDIFTEDTMISEHKIEDTVSSEYEFEYEYSGKIGNFSIGKIISSGDAWSEQKIKNVNNLSSVVMNDEKIKSDLYRRFKKETDCPAMYTDDGLFIGYGIGSEGYADANIAVVMITNVLSKNDGGHDGKLVFCYDADTLELLSNEETIKRLFGDDWTQNCNFSYRGEAVSCEELSEGIKNMVPSYFFSYTDKNRLYQSISFDTVETEVEDIINYGGKYSIVKK